MSFLSMKFLLFLAAAVAGYYVIPKTAPVGMAAHIQVYILSGLRPGGGNVQK